MAVQVGLWQTWSETPKLGFLASGLILCGFCSFSASVICAWGEDGAAGITKGGSVVSAKAFPPDSLIDTLGAGDTFNAATILALCEGKTLQEAVTFGCRVAGVKCGIMGFKELKGMQKFL